MKRHLTHQKFLKGHIFILHLLTSVDYKTFSKWLERDTMALIQQWDHSEPHLSTSSYLSSVASLSWYFSYASAAKENCKQERWQWQT